MQEELAKEQRILRAMRELLAQIVKDTTPSAKYIRHPLSDKTIHAIRDCFGLIAARERELGEALGSDLSRRPRYKDAPATHASNDTVVVPLKKIKPKNMN